MPSTVPIRLTDENMARLESAAKSTHRSRSFLVNTAIEQQFRDIESGTPQDMPIKKGRLDRLLAMEGIGAKLYGPRTQEDIDAEIRELRGDE